MHFAAAIHASREAPAFSGRQAFSRQLTEGNMVRTLKLLFTPGQTWERMALNPPNAMTVALISLLPMMALTLGIEGYALLRLGEQVGGIGKQLQLAPERVIRYEVFYAAASLVVILAGSWLLKSVADSFGVLCKFGGVFVLLAYGFMPMFLLRILDGVPQVNTWICWIIGAVLAARILYHGVALWLKPEQTKGFGLFLVSMVYTLVLSGLVHFAAVQVLHGKLLKNVYPDRVSAASPAGF